MLLGGMRHRLTGGWRSKGLGELAKGGSRVWLRSQSENGSVHLFMEILTLHRILSRTMPAVNACMHLLMVAPAVNACMHLLMVAASPGLPKP
jgi:hypothetical protein